MMIRERKSSDEPYPSRRRGSMPVTIALGLSMALVPGCAIVSGGADELRAPDDPRPLTTLDDIAQQRIAARVLDEHVQFLTSDQARGRNASGSGLDRVAAWVASELQLAGLEPAGDDGGFIRYEAHDAYEAGGQPGYAPNVIALLPGSGPSVAHEYVVVIARLGLNGGEVRAAPASAVAALVEVARAFAALPGRPARSIVFVAWSGQEWEASGERWLSGHPTVGVARSTAAVGIGEIGEPDAGAVEVEGHGHASVGALLASTAEETSRLELPVIVGEAGGAAGAGPGTPVWVSSVRIDAAVEASGDGNRNGGWARNADRDRAPIDVELAARIAQLVFLTVHRLASDGNPPTWLGADRPATGVR